MKDIYKDIKSCVSEVLAEWERLVRVQPRFSLPAEHRIGSPPDAAVGLVETSSATSMGFANRRTHAQKNGADSIPNLP